MTAIPYLQNESRNFVIGDKWFLTKFNRLMDDPLSLLNKCQEIQLTLNTLWIALRPSRGVLCRTVYNLDTVDLSYSSYGQVQTDSHDFRLLLSCLTPYLAV
jgi:hypothetical protein